MLYLVCPTCNRLLADKMIPYEEGIIKICDNPHLTHQQKEEEKIKLITSLIILQDRYCCRSRLMTYRDLVKIVK